ncbi:MAG: uncharacterized protein PWR30_253 [Candidatus Woesearchaeota archaeon]|nr:uncharacterized protein [Candidatus Woesearchaeota archaeon]
MNEFKIEEYSRIPKLRKAIAFEGLPGIANVGKIAVDYLTKSLKSKKFLSITSDYFPAVAYITEKNSIQRAKVDFSYSRIKKHDFIFITGNSQPSSEPYSYIFARLILKWLAEHDVNTLITTGGIGLLYLPQNPKVYCITNKRHLAKEFEHSGANTNAYGVVGSIAGATGLLTSLADEFKLDAASLLAETLANPFYVGISSAKSLVEVLNEKYNLGIKKEEIEKEFKEPVDVDGLKDISPKTKQTESYKMDVNYIG